MSQLSKQNKPSNIKNPLPPPPSTSHPQIDLKQNQITRINHLITNFAKSEPNLLKYSQTLMLILDRCILSNKFTLSNFHNLFINIYTKGNKNLIVQEQKALSKQQLIVLFNQIAKKMYHQNDKKYLNRFYNTFLSEKIDTNGENQVNHSRVMVFDSNNLKMLNQESIKKISEYQQELKHIFIAYLFENYWTLKKSNRILLNMRQIIIQNKSWSYPSLIHFLKDSETSPHLLSVEHVEEVLRLIVPNTSSKQQQFYSRHVLSDGYHKDVENVETTFHAGDPGIVFFQFQLLIARIALDSYPKQLQKNSGSTLGNIIQRYFSYLMLRTNQQISTKQLPHISRKMISFMASYYKILENDNQKQNNKQEQKLKEKQMTPFEQLAQKINEQIMNGQNLDIDFNECLKNLDKQLPKLPPVPIVEQEVLPPYDKSNAITIGQQPPPQPADQMDKIKVEKKKQGGKKDQPTPRQFKWADVPTNILSGQDYLKQIETKLNFQVQPLSSIQRGTLKSQHIPVLIGQTLCPSQLPKLVAPFITAASNAMIDRNFYLAIQNYNKGMNFWKESNIDFQPINQLFFEYSKGCIYLSVGKYQYALQQFYMCRKFAEPSKLSYSNPDRSLPYFGLGELFYQLQQYEISARCFLKARQIRQQVLGLQHVQTASTFNNLAACYYMLGRSHQALGYIQIAQVILDTQLGEHHQRTMTSRSNLKLISHGTFENKPQYRKFWQVFEQDKFQKKKKKKEKQAKKK